MSTTELDTTRESVARSGWKIGSLCLIFSRSKNKWLEGEIVELDESTEDTKTDEWMTVKYGANKKQTKRIQRHCKDIVPMPKDHPSRISSGSKCKIYSEVIRVWCDGTVIEIFNDDEGEWLKVQYDEYGASKICDIQRYSKDILLVPYEKEAKPSSMYEEKELDIFEEIKHILITKEMIKRRINELGTEITQYYLDENKDEDPQLVCIGILNGGFMFCADLIRSIKIPHRVEFMRVKSYTGSKQADHIDIILDLSCSVENKNVLIIEDLIDTGNTMMWLSQHLKSKQAKSVKIVCLLQKKTKRLNKDFKIKIDWIGFPTVPDEWIIGFGIDYKYRYRHLPYIASLKEAVYCND